MDWQRYTLVGGIAAVLLALIYQWNAFQEQHTPARDQKTVVNHQAAPGTETLPNSQTQTGADSGELPDGSIPEVGTSNQPKLISVKTDTLSLLIDPNGGDIVKVALRKFYEEIDTPDRPLILLNQTRSHTYVARSGLVGGKGACSAGRPVFSSDASEYAMQEGADTLTVDLKQSQNGIGFTKRFTFSRACAVKLCATVSSHQWMWVSACHRSSVRRCTPVKKTTSSRTLKTSPKSRPLKPSWVAGSRWYSTTS